MWNQSHLFYGSDEIVYNFLLIDEYKILWNKNFE